MFCTGDATAILMRNAASAGRERERLRSISVILIQSNLSTPWEQKMVIVERASVMGRQRLINMRIFLRKYNVTCYDQLMLTVSHTIVDPMDNLCLLQRYKWNTIKMQLPRLIINAS